MVGWTHTQKKFFKYMSSGTARVVLANGTLRWSAPKQFNDPFDIQFDMHIEHVDKAKLIADVANDLWLFYSRQSEYEPKNRLGYFVRDMSVKGPRLSEAEFRAAVQKGVTESLYEQQRRLPELHSWVRARLEKALVLCLTEMPSNILMWAHYADCHRGVVLEFSTLEASSWAAARPVSYRERMPLLFDQEQLRQFLSGCAVIDKDRFFLESFLTKSIDWKYEREWRVVWHATKEIDFEDTKFNPQELAGIYFGCRVDKKDCEDLVSLARKLNPEVQAWMGKKSLRTFAVEFDRFK